MPEKTYKVEVSFRRIRRLRADFLSFTVDTSVMIGGRWWGPSKGLKQGLSRDRVAPLDWEDPQLRFLASALSPALLRIGGTEADQIRYGFSKEGPDPLEPIRDTGSGSFVLKKKLWKRVGAFARFAGFRLLFTLSAGPSSRTDAGVWDPAPTLRLVSYSVRKNMPVAGWELGNEVNAYPFIYGWGHRVSPRQYAQDFAAFVAEVRRIDPEGFLVGPSSAFWPVIGEPNPLLKAFCRSPSGRLADAVSFHYYPQQSERGRLAVRRAGTRTLLSSPRLDGLNRWIRHVQRSLPPVPGRPQEIWLTETGHALYGGQPGVSDTWVSSLWWTDQLALAAHRGIDVVFRQSLAGGDYGVLSLPDFCPRPDYFVSFLWKRLLGSGVLEKPRCEGPDRRLRVWAFDSQHEGRFWLVVISLNWRRPARLVLDWSPRRLLILEGDENPLSRSVRINGVPGGLDLIEHWDKVRVQKKYGLTDRPGLGPFEMTVAPASVILLEGEWPRT